MGSLSLGGKLTAPWYILHWRALRKLLFCKFTIYFSRKAAEYCDSLQHSRDALQHYVCLKLIGCMSMSFYEAIHLESKNVLPWR
jgi:hypothetical protein